MNLSKLPKMPSRQFDRTCTEATETFFGIVDEMISAGRGRELPSETMAKAELPDADMLTFRYASNARLRAALFAERDSRIKYHGTTKPIP
jgi:hypothetical protein